MAQHLVAGLVPPRNRRWLGPQNLLGSDRCVVVQSGRLDTTNFWHVLMHNPHLDQVLFTRS